MSGRVLWFFDRAAGYTRKVMVQEGVDTDSAAAILAETRARFAELLPRIPDPGPDAAHLHAFTLASAAELALWLSMKERGYTPQQVYRIAEQVMRGLLEKLPGFARRGMGAPFYWKTMIDRIRKGGELSQQRPLGGWQWEFVEGDGTFDYGVNYTRCAIQDLAREIGAQEFGPYICLADLTASELLGWGLQRTQTIGQGCQSCDFRFCKGKATNVAVPPGLLDDDPAH